MPITAAGSKAWIRYLRNMLTKVSVAARFCAAAIAIVACAACAGAGPVPPDGVLSISGTLTGEGVECPALRGNNGELYTLAGDVGGAAVGDEVCVMGRLVELSICQQGTTVSVEKIIPGTCDE